MDGGLVWSLVAGAAFLAAVGVAAIFREMRRVDRNVAEALARAGAQLAAEGLAPGPPGPPGPPTTPPTVEDIHRRYEGMKVSDPHRASARIYAELLEIHPR